MYCLIKNFTWPCLYRHSPEYRTLTQMDSPEYKTLTLCHPALIYCIGQTPYDIAVHLVSSGILAQHDIEYLSNYSIANDEKASRLLDSVLNQVQINPQVYHTFIAALKDVGLVTKALVTELEGIYAVRAQSPVADVHSTEEPGESLVLIFVHILVRFQPPHTLLVHACQLYTSALHNPPPTTFLGYRRFWLICTSGHVAHTV